MYKKYPAWSDGKPKAPDRNFAGRDVATGIFRRCVDFQRARTSLEQRTFATRLQRWVRGLGSDVDTAFARQQPGISRQIPEGSTAPDRREVAMTMSEYEERFRPPAASLYQTLTVASGRNAGQRRRRIWVVAAAIGVLAITWGAASHHAVDGWTSRHSRTTAFYGQKLAAAVSDEFSVFPCWKAASSANETAEDPGRFAVFPATIRLFADTSSQTSERTVND